jgi:hypothetical protein
MTDYFRTNLTPPMKRHHRNANPDSDALALRLAQALDDGSERLPYRITHRLQAARQAALTVHAKQLAPVLAPVLASNRGSFEDQPSLAWRILATVLPIAAISAGFMAIADLGDALEADETAEIDEAVLTDEVPISAYADHGFGVFLKNNRP